MSQRIKELIQTQVGKSEVRDDDDLVEDLDFDSLDIVELVIAIEDEFSIEISDAKVENLKTVEDVVNMVKSHNI